MGLVGAGKHGSRYAQHIVADLPREIRLVALWRRDREAGEAAARQYGCRYEPDVARLLAERIRGAVEALEPEGIGQVTISAGVARFENDYDFSATLRTADKRLYQAKASGRNTVV